MRRLVFAALLVCSLMSATAFAGTIIYLAPNGGGGDNFGFVTYGPNFYATALGSLSADVFSDFPPGYAPGSTIFGGGMTIFFDNGGFARVGPISSDLALTGGTLFISSITLPTNGKDFKAFVNVNFDAFGTLLANGASFDAGGSANGYIVFSYFNGAYYPSGFTEVPEPGTVSLVTAGVLGILPRARNKFRR
jgi:hypothetical protein